MAPPDVICIGEALVDFLPLQPGRAVSEVDTWRRCSGGSPANVAVGLARLGAKSAMLGVVGLDEFGSFLLESLRGEGVDVSHLRRTPEGKTGLVFISLSADGERSFSFYRTQAAEFLLDGRDVDRAFLASAGAIHLGTNSLLYRPAQEAVLEMARAAREAGRIVCCDPNLRLHVWKDPGVLRALLEQLLPSCTVVKLAEDEIEFVTGTSQVERALEVLHRKGVALPVVTRGPAGAVLLWNGQLVRVPAPAVEVVDTTGAGDGFVAGLLFGLTRRCPEAGAVQALGEAELSELVAFACQVGSRVVRNVGAVAGLPTRLEMAEALPPSLR